MKDTPNSSQALRLLRWPLVVVLLAATAYLVVHRVLSTVDDSEQQVVDLSRELVASAGDIAERFLTGQITTTFTAAIPSLVPGQSLSLEVAAFEAPEILTREDERRAFFDLVPLGKTVTEIKVPVTYRYHIKLDEAWLLTVRDRTCIVEAPRIHPTLPPAIHTDRMEKRLDSDWLRFDGDDQMAALESSITPTISARAGNDAHLELVREICRQRVAEFVRGWLLYENHWREDRFTAVIVKFADEDPSNQTTPPTIRYQRSEDSE